mgnify:CR=1 FL=1
MNIKSYVQINEPIAQFTVTEEAAELNLTVLIKTVACCSSGDKLNVYSVRLPLYEFYFIATISLPDEYSGFFAKPFTSNHYYGVPHNSRQIHILKIKVILYLIYCFRTDQICPKKSQSCTYHSS